MNLDDAKKVLSREVDNMSRQLIDLSDRIHANPEIKMEEVKACAWHVEFLRNHGFDVEVGVAGLPTAFAARRQVGSGGPTIAYLAEYDALPAIGHACGHNIIGAASDGAGISLFRTLERVGEQATVLVYGTPGEEGGGGKVFFVKEGMFDGVDIVLMTHPANRTIVCRGSFASGRISCQFFGKSAHGASSPHLGINALDGAVQTITMVNGLRQMVTPDVRIMGIISHGGQAVNAIPEFAECWFSIRAERLDTHREVMDRVRTCAQAAATATGNRLELYEPDHYPHYPVRVNPTLGRLFKANAEQLGEAVDTGPLATGKGSTDYGNVSWVVPGEHAYIAIVPPHAAGHSVELREASASEAGHRGLLLAAKALGMTGLDLVCRPELIQQARADFEAFAER